MESGEAEWLRTLAEAERRRRAPRDDMGMSTDQLLHVEQQAPRRPTASEIARAVTAQAGRSDDSLLTHQPPLASADARGG